MNLPAPPLPSTGLPRSAGAFGSRWVQIGLVSVFALVLLGLWTLPELAALRQSTQWFPTSLHSMTETFSIVVSAMVFAVSWYAYRPEQPGNIIILACGFLAAALLDFGHLLSYRGMPDFVTPASPQKAISFWLCARLLSAAMVLVIAFRAWRPLRHPESRYVLMAVTVAAVAAIYYLQLWHPQLWPRFYIEGQGLTPIKIAIEMAVISIMAVVAIRLWFARAVDPPYMEGMLTASLLWILSELSLMAYENVNDVFSLFGHVIKVIAYVFIYRLVFVASVRDPYDRLAVEIARKQAAERQVEALAFYDVLTGLPNKALLRDRATQILSARRVDNGQCALLLLNVDGLKHINDSYGHAFGDAVLRAVAERLPGCVGRSDTVSGVGGDEFALMLHEVADSEAVASAVERIRFALGRPMQVQGHELRITASMGAATSPGDGLAFETLFQNACTALHKAKESGGDSWRFYDATMNRDVADRLNLRSGLRLALERSELVLHYQPQLDLASGALVGVEALVRWQHPERGMVPPLQFIPAAEDSGLIVPIGQWVLHEACRQAVAWQRAGITVPVVAVNLSAVQFQRGNIEDAVLDALATSGLPASHLELELTESILIQDAPAVLATVRKLKAMGVRLSIDDFGTGYSSLAYLRDFPVDTLKIDQSFIRDIRQRSDGEVMVAAIIQLAKTLGLATIAEGVEDEATADALRRLECDHAQGFLYARALPAAELEAFLLAPSRLHRASPNPA